MTESSVNKLTITDNMSQRSTKFTSQHPMFFAVNDSHKIVVESWLAYMKKITYLTRLCFDS